MAAQIMIHPPRLAAMKAKPGGGRFFNPHNAASHREHPGGQGFWLRKTPHRLLTVSLRYAVQDKV
jgi:hypothetical protein